MIALAPVRSKCACDGGRSDFDDSECGLCGGTGIRERHAKHEERGHVHTFRVPSNTESRRWYTLHWWNGRSVCNCLGFNTHGHCDHSRRVNEAMEATMERTGTDIALRNQDALEVYPPKSTLPTEHELNLIRLISNAVAKARDGGFVPAHIKTPEQAAVIMLYGWELGLRPMTALQHVFLVNGRAALSAQAMMGIVMAKVPGARFEIVHSDGQSCTMRLHMPGRPPAELTYTLEMAKTAGQLSKPGPWHQYAPDMLRWTVAKRLCRLFAAHIINSIDGSMIGDRMATADALVMEPISPVLETAEEIPAIPEDAYNPGDETESDWEARQAAAEADFEAAEAAGQEPLL